MSVVSGARGRALAALTDQAVCSAGNFVVLLAALHLLDLAAVGAYTIAYGAAMWTLAVVRPLVLEPVMLRFAATAPREQSAAAAGAAGAAAAIGLLLAAACALAATVLPSTAAAVVLGAGLAMPMLLVQDAWRYAFFTAGRPWAAAANDAVCLAAIVALLVGAGILGDPGPGLLLALWGAGLGVGAVAGCRQLRVLPAVGRASRTLREHRDLGLPMAGAALVVQGASRVALILVGAAAGMAAVGQIYAALALLTPVNVLLLAAPIFAVPETIRRLDAGRVVARQLFALSAVLGGAVLAFALVTALLPDGVGRLWVGENWEHARALLWPVAVWATATAAYVGAKVALQARSLATTIARLSLAQGGLQIACTVLGLIPFGVTGAAWGLAGGSVVATGLWWLAARRALPRSGIPRQANWAWGMHRRDVVNVD
ncbi:MAG: hypothetical protein ACT4QG_22810 [Sporichthyaceae bacterium]